MASANALGYLLPLGVGAVGIASMSLLHIDLKTLATDFVTGPGRTSRILLALFVVANWKNMPFVWTVSSPPPSIISCHNHAVHQSADTPSSRFSSESGAP